MFPRYWSDALVGGGWRADGEASIASYFSNALLMEFSNVFRVWVRQQLQSEPLDEEVADSRGLDKDESDERMHVLAQMRGLPPRQRQVVALHYDGYSHAEIVEVTGATSERAVEAVLYRWRRQQADPGSRAEGREGKP